MPALFKLVLIMIIAIAFTGQSFAVAFYTPCSSTIQTKNIVIENNNEQDHSASAQETEHEDECCSTECCETDCACLGQSCTSSLFLVANLGHYSFLSADESQYFQHPSFPIPSLTHLYRPPIIA